MKYILVVILFLVYAAAGLFFRLGTTQSSAPSPTPYVFNTDTMLSLVSDWRVAHNLPSVTENEHLCEIAEERAVEVQTDWSHNQFTAERVCDETACDVGENLSKNYPIEGQILSAWEASPAHLAVLDFPSYKYGCVAENNEYVVLLLSNVDLK